jgi:hypothetical protein
MFFYRDASHSNSNVVEFMQGLSFGDPATASPVVIAAACVAVVLEEFLERGERPSIRLEIDQGRGPVELLSALYTQGDLSTVQKLLASQIKKKSPSDRETYAILQGIEDGIPWEDMGPDIDWGLRKISAVWSKTYYKSKHSFAGSLDGSAIFRVAAGMLRDLDYDFNLKEYHGEFSVSYVRGSATSMGISVNQKKMYEVSPLQRYDASPDGGLPLSPSARYYDTQAADVIAFSLPTLTEWPDISRSLMQYLAAMHHKKSEVQYEAEVWATKTLPRLISNVGVYAGSSKYDKVAALKKVSNGVKLKVSRAPYPPVDTKELKALIGSDLRTYLMKCWGGLGLKPYFPPYRMTTREEDLFYQACMGVVRQGFKRGTLEAITLMFMVAHCVRNDHALSPFELQNAMSRIVELR